MSTLENALQTDSELDLIFKFAVFEIFLRILPIFYLDLRLASISLMLLNPELIASLLSKFEKIFAYFKSRPAY